jgi:hypothetical protein
MRAYRGPWGSHMARSKGAVPAPARHSMINDEQVVVATRLALEDADMASYADMAKAGVAVVDTLNGAIIVNTPNSKNAMSVWRVSSTNGARTVQDGGTAIQSGHINNASAPAYVRVPPAVPLPHERLGHSPCTHTARRDLATSQSTR